MSSPGSQPLHLFDLIAALRDHRSRRDRHWDRFLAIEAELKLEDQAIRTLIGSAIDAIQAADARQDKRHADHEPRYFDGPDGSTWLLQHGEFKELAVERSLDVRIAGSGEATAEPVVDEPAAVPANNVIPKTTGFWLQATNPYADCIESGKDGCPWLKSCGVGVKTVLGLIDSGMGHDSVIRMHQGMTYEDIAACRAWRANSQVVPAGAMS